VLRHPTLLRNCEVCFANSRFVNVLMLRALGQ
jgi:hypothetical protein